MNDLIERLRKHREYRKSKVDHRCNYCGNVPANWHPLICTEAADRIEELEAENAKLLAAVQDILDEVAGNMDACAYNIAKDALEDDDE